MFLEKPRMSLNAFVPDFSGSIGGGNMSTPSPRVTNVASGPSGGHCNGPVLSNQSTGNPFTGRAE